MITDNRYLRYFTGVEIDSNKDGYNIIIIKLQNLQRIANWTYPQEIHITLLNISRTFNQL